MLPQAGCLQVMVAETRSLHPSRQGWPRDFTASDMAVAGRLLERLSSSLCLDLQPLSKGRRSQGRSR